MTYSAWDGRRPTFGPGTGVGRAGAFQVNGWDAGRSSVIRAVFEALWEAAACVLAIATVFWVVVFLGRIWFRPRRYSKVRLKPAARSKKHG